VNYTYDETHEMKTLSDWLIDVSTEPPETEPLTYELSVGRLGLGRLPWVFFAVYLIVIAIGPWPIKIVFAALLFVNLFVVLVPKRTNQGVSVDATGVLLQWGYGPPTHIPLQDIVSAEVGQTSPGLLGRILNAIGPPRTSGYRSFEYPYVKVRLKRRMWRILWSPIPAPGFTKRVILPVWDNTGLAAEINRRLAQQATPR
jgi:hypothetical protein